MSSRTERTVIRASSSLLFAYSFCEVFTPWHPMSFSSVLLVAKKKKLRPVPAAIKHGRCGRIDFYGTRSRKHFYCPRYVATWEGGVELAGLKENHKLALRHGRVCLVCARDSE